MKYLIILLFLISCTQPIVAPPVDDLTEFEYKDCNNEEFKLRIGSYYHIYWFGNFYFYMYQELNKGKYIFYDGGMGYECTFNELIELIETCDILEG